jgi:hypothetical protein
MTQEVLAGKPFAGERMKLVRTRYLEAEHGEDINHRLG